ncbi:hypothetical protein HYH03_017481 [Edaphochlamys debaryana]|uniref:Uncharacterized protein n=1 Tax=Edaphochlamys debaryana TaxID=47281 RepID=A0A835XGJ7_9CHLO|nr:hypothetical protein HYH03_017481 [Edaphochlamys debaryana]|eukprot:KAG2483678.1 hypothetical protein HYH03_017481 [Edaphochlamys debaryana]
MPAKLLTREFLAEMAALGPDPITPARLYLAVRGRNLLRNPAFRRDSNTLLLELGRPLGAWNKWTRNAWVTNKVASTAEVGWEQRPEGFSAEGGAGAGAPPPPAPYAGGGLRLGEKVHAVQAKLSGLLHALAERGAAAAAAAAAELEAAAASLAAGEPEAAAAALRAEAEAEAEAADPVSPSAATAEAEVESVEGLAEGLAAADGEQAEAVAAASGPSRVPAEAEKSSTSTSTSSAAAAPAVTCIASPVDWIEVLQVVDLSWELQQRGLSAPQAALLLDQGLALRFSVHVGSRHGCIGQYCVGLMLDEGAGAGGGGGRGNGGDAAARMQSFVPRPGRLSYFSGRLRCAQTDAWERFAHAVPACPVGARRALVLLRGRRAGGEEGAEGAEGAGGGGGGGAAPQVLRCAVRER